MTRRPDRPLSHLALIGALAVLFVLTGCGRKGPLDPPPGAASATGKQQQTDTSLIRSPFGGPANPNTVAAPKSSNKHFILDPLLN